MLTYEYYMKRVNEIINKYNEEIINRVVCENLLTNLLIELDCIDIVDAKKIQRKNIISFINGVLNQIDQFT